jgi:amino acid adenylation domain-containing protein
MSTQNTVNLSRSILTISEQLPLDELGAKTSALPPLIHRCFEVRAEQFPDAIAIVDREIRLTYRQLNKRANQLAHYLKKLGVESNTLVGLKVERSLESIIAILSVLKAGGTYVPLDSNCSKHDLKILKEAHLSIILTLRATDEEFHHFSGKVVCLDQNRKIIQQQPQENLSADEIGGLAAILYTTDRTQSLKGICLTHQGIIQLATKTAYVALNAAEIFIQVAALSSEIALFEIWGSLLTGNQLVIFPSDLISPAVVGRTILQYQVTILSLPTRIFHRMVDEQLENFQSVRQLYVGGDWLSPTHVQKFYQRFPELTIYNVYSVAENTGFTCCYPVTAPLFEGTIIPIGRVLNDTQGYILDQSRKPTPIGVVGELYISGDRLAQGYYNHSALTETAFTDNPFSQKNARLYKTGDLARWLDDGTIELVGSTNSSSLQDILIESGKIEAALCEHPSIKESFVLVQRGIATTDSLVAYVTLDSKYPTKNELHQFLQEKISNYRIPSAYVFLYALPLNINGSIDRNALPIPNLSKQTKELFTAPRDEIEQQLATIWQKFLGHHSISVHDNFFALGGHSLLSVRLISEIEKTFNYRLPLSSFSQISTIAETAQLIREQNFANTYVDELPLGMSLEDYRTLLFHSAGREGKHVGKRGLIIETSPPEQKSSQPFIWVGDINVSKKLNLKQPIYTMPANSWEPLHSTENYISIIASLLVDELLSVQPEGPYTIGAYCFEGIVALEMAQQLQQKGKEIDLLTIIDKDGPSVLYQGYCKLNRYFNVLRVETHQLLKRPLSLIGKWEYIKKRFRRRAEFILNIPDRGETLIKYQTIALLDKVMNNYTPKPYSGNVVLVKSTKTDLSIDEEDLFQLDIPWLFPCFGWEGLLTGRIETYTIPCKHLEVYENPHVKVLGNILENVLSALDTNSFNQQS